MVDVGKKPTTRRRAVARGRVRLGREAFEALASGRLSKGDALAVARIAGILGAKKTPELVPLAHPVPLDAVAVECELDSRLREVVVTATVSTAARTGVEMEALTGVSVALLTIWDLVKPVNPALEITAVRLLYKSGGKRGTWTHPDGLPPEAQAIIEAL